jgi:hypothetical protein
MIPDLLVLPNNLYWDLVKNLITENGGMSESIIVHKRIVQLRKSIEHYKKTSQIIPIEWMIELNHLESVGMNFCQSEFNKIIIDYSDN